MKTIKIGAVTIPVFVVALLVISIFGVAMISSTWQIGNRGVVKTIGLKIYSDIDGTIFLTEINWGNVSAGEVIEEQTYCMLIGNTPANLSFSTTNYIPLLAEQYMDLTWDHDGTTLQPDTIYPLKFMLAIASDI